jgi:hypothetical protein
VVTHIDFVQEATVPLVVWPGLAEPDTKSPAGRLVLELPRALVWLHREEELAFQLHAADREAQLLAGALELHLLGAHVRSERQEQDNLLVGLCVGVR